MNEQVFIERLVPTIVSTLLFREHESRYMFAAGFVQNRFVIDVACGVGIGTHYLSGAGACSCIGFDIDGPALSYARSHYPGCRFVQCDAAHMPLCDGSADVVVSFETLEHLPEPSSFLAECCRVLKPGGVLVCSTPNYNVSRWGGHNPFHRMEFLPEEFQKMAARTFVDIKLYGQNGVVYPTYVVRRLASRTLDSLGLKSLVTSVMRGAPAPFSTATEFGSAPPVIDGLIEPYKPGWLRQPLYVVIVARKPRG